MLEIAFPIFSYETLYYYFLYSNAWGYILNADVEGSDETYPELPLQHWMYLF